MPGKGRRVASRQAELGRRRKRQQKGALGAPSTEAEPTDVQPRPSGSVATQVRESPTSEQTPPPAPARPSPVASSRSPARSRAERSAVYNYIGSEVRRILIMASVVVVVLIALTFVL